MEWNFVATLDAWVTTSPRIQPSRRPELSVTRAILGA